MSKHYHFIGIGGIGMSAIASLLVDQGRSISGSDVRANNVTEQLKAKGVKIYIGHDRSHVHGANVVVYSSAIAIDNPELSEAAARRIPLMKRAELLAELMEGQIGITIAGAHGKTTTTSMAAHVLTQAGLHPTTAVGGILKNTNSNARLGAGQYFVTEVDESDGSFLFFSPVYSLITNIDFEHVDQYPDWESIMDAYKAFIGNTDPTGTVIAFGDDQRLRALVEASGRKFRTYGFSPENDIRAVNPAFNCFTSRFECFNEGTSLGSVQLNVAGRHNVANAMACIALGLSLKIDFSMIRDSLAQFSGVQRRFQLKGTIDNVWVIDDYAHHPTEIRAAIETGLMFKQSLAGQANELITVFQPHRYTRLAALMEEFARALILSDQLIITDVYAASEPPIAGVTAKLLADRIRALTHIPVFYLPKDEIVDYLAMNVKPKDIVMTLGAGDITQTADDLASALKRRVAAGGLVT